MPPKMKKKGRPREQKPLLSDCRKQKSKEVLSVSPNPSQSLARWKRIGSYWNVLQTRLMLLLLLMVQDFCQLITCLVLMQYQIQPVMKILIFIAERNILIKLDGIAALENFHKKEKSGWTCLACHKHISKEESSVICERCLRWCHLSCTTLKRPPRSRNWICKVCTIKFT